jgi:hypothetical protein
MSVAGTSIVADAVLSRLGLQEHLQAHSGQAGFEAMAVARPEGLDAPVSAERPRQ